MQYVSLDSGIKEQSEYIRGGLNLDKCLHNTEEFLTRVPYRNSLTYIITMSNLNILGLRKLLEIILEQRKKHSQTYQRVWFDTPLLRQPAWQSLQILPASYVRILEDVADWMESHQLPEGVDRFDGFKDYEVQRMRRNIAWMKNGRDLDPEYIKQQRADFYRFFNEYDKRRGFSFINRFPTMKEFWQECRYYAENT
jgi:hypothetical protein